MGIIEDLEELVERSDFGFESFFRERGIALRDRYHASELDLNAATEIPKEVISGSEFRLAVEGNLPDLKARMVDVVTSPVSARLLWHLYCTPIAEKHSALAHLVPTLADTIRVVRAGPNIYKMNGWLVHVLVGYSLATQYFPQGRLPATILWDSAVEEFCNERLKSAYHSLDRVARAVFHLAMLGHDIGVAKEVANHDVHGVPIVPKYLADLNVSRGALRQRGLEIHSSDLVWAAQGIVRFHTLINRAGVELSVDRVRSELAQLVESSSESSWRKGFIRRDYPTILLLLGTADLIAVNDELLTERKSQEVVAGYNMVVSLLGSEPRRDHSEAQGLARFRSFLSDSIFQVDKSTLDAVLVQLHQRPADFWMKFSALQEVDFALSLMRRMPTSSDALGAFVLIFAFIDQYIGEHLEDAYGSTCVKLDPNLELEKVVAEVRETSDLGSFRFVAEGKLVRLGRLGFEMNRDHENFIVKVTAHG